MRNMLLKIHLFIAFGTAFVSISGMDNRWKGHIYRARHLILPFTYFYAHTACSTISTCFALSSASIALYVGKIIGLSDKYTALAAGVVGCYAFYLGYNFSTKLTIARECVRNITALSKIAYPTIAERIKNANIAYYFENQKPGLGPISIAYITNNDLRVAANVYQVSVPEMIFCKGVGFIGTEVGLLAGIIASMKIYSYIKK